MKKCIIIFILLIILSITGCRAIVADTTVKTVIITETSIVEVENTQRITELEADIERLKVENEAYYSLIASLNEYLSYIYPMKVSNANYSSEGIGFSIKYQDKFYMITAGHGVHYTYENIDVLYTNFKFLDEGWTSLKLLDYNNDYTNKNDYAIFISDKIDSGFNVDLDNDNPLFIINDTKLISNYTRKTVEGESGSPVVDLEGEVTEIATTDIYSYNTDIDIVLEAIANLK
jgi:hypothetical protein